MHVDANMNVRKQIMRELQFMHDCNSKHIVSFYGAFMNGGDISICMEHMDVGFVLLECHRNTVLSSFFSSLDKIYKKHGPFPFDVLKKVAYAVSEQSATITLFDKTYHNTY